MTTPVTTLKAVRNIVQSGSPILLRGAGWPDCPTLVSLGGRQAKIEKILKGYPVPGGVRPTGGEFMVRLAGYGLKPGHYKVSVKGGSAITKAVNIEIKRRLQPSRNDEEEDDGLGYWRSLAIFERRFGHIGYVPPGVGAARARSINQLRLGSRRQPIHKYSKPVPGGTNWTPLGPAPVVSAPMLPTMAPQTSLSAVSGRVLSIAVDPMRSAVNPNLPSRVYIGTVNGGVWKSIDGGASWSPKTDDQPSMAIGALAADPNNPNRVFAGTGEYQYNDSYGNYFGAGILYSSDYGETWTQLATGTFDQARITRILFDPTYTTGNHMLLASEIGVYETTTGGTSWTQLRAGAASDLVLYLGGNANPGLVLIAAFAGEGLFTSTLAGGAWSTWSGISSPALPSTLGRISLGQSQNNPMDIWAVFSDAGGNDVLGIASSADGGGSWTTVGLPAGAVYSAGEILSITVHPNKPGTVFLGLPQLWRTDTGGAPWTEVENVSTIHMDHHALVFDPINPSNIFVGCDGGAYRSTDGGVTWNHGNLGLATLQFYCISNHPQWAAVILAGMQDNAAGFCTGTPDWSAIGGGDVVAAAIDPLVPQTIYYGTYGKIYRSDDCGQTWPANYQINQAYEWNFPFILDPSGVCYVGGKTLQRGSDKLATAPVAVTPALNGNITTIAVNPANSDILYVGTSTGHVYSVQRTGPDWTLANVQTTDITGTGLLASLAGLYISCVAVDMTGNVWVSFSSILQPQEPGVFTNDHVYYLPAGSSTWLNRSAGLAQANPINALAIDPDDDTNVFCGGDSSVFQWNDGAGQWELWDQGLPNAPVFQLAIHNPSRLIRAATFGRSIWERPIDPAVEPMVDIFLRDDILDVPGGNPAPSGVPNPFDPPNLVWFWQSEDIKVDASGPAFQTPAAVTDDVALANNIQHQNPVRGMVNRFYVQVHNRGPLTATNVSVRAFFADCSLGVPNLPSDFWTGPNPFNGDPTAVDWVPIGPASTPVDLEPGRTAVVSWGWLVPTTAAAHSCLFAICTSTEDGLDLPGNLNSTDIIVNQNNATLKNLTIVG